MATTESSDLVARIVRLENLLNQMEQIVLMLQQRLAANEQSLGQRWLS